MKQSSFLVLTISSIILISNNYVEASSTVTDVISEIGLTRGSDMSNKQSSSGLNDTAHSICPIVSLSCSKGSLTMQIDNTLSNVAWANITCVRAATTNSFSFYVPLAAFPLSTNINNQPCGNRVCSGPQVINCSIICADSTNNSIFGASARQSPRGCI